MWTMLLAVSALAQSLDLVALEAAERTEGPEEARLASEKRAETIERLTGLLLKRDVAPETQAELRLRLADVYYQDGRIEDAAPLYEAIIEETPSYGRVDQARFFLARCHHATGRLVEAANGYEEVVRSHPRSRWLPASWLQLGELSSSSGDTRAAYEAYEEYIRSPDEPRHDYGTYRLGWAAHQLDDHDTARRLLAASAASSDSQVADAARRDLRELYGEAPPPTPPPPPPVAPGCGTLEAELRQQIQREPNRAPELQLAIVACWAEVDRGRAMSELARMEHEYGRKSAWVKARDKTAARAASDALARAREMCPR